MDHVQYYGRAYMPQMDHFIDTFLENIFSNRKIVTSPYIHTTVLFKTKISPAYKKAPAILWASFSLINCLMQCVYA